MNDNETSASSNRWGELIELQPQQLIQIALLGAVAGAATWLLGLFVRQVIFVPLFCGDPTNGLCVGAPELSSNIATLFAAVIALLGLVRFSVYRPLLIVIAAAISLWGLGTWTAGLPWFESIAWAVLLYAFAYVLFAWLVRPRSFVFALVIVAVVVILARVLPSF